MFCALVTGNNSMQSTSSHLDCSWEAPHRNSQPNKHRPAQWHAGRVCRPGGLLMCILVSRLRLWTVTWPLTAAVPLLSWCQECHSAYNATTVTAFDKKLILPYFIWNKSERILVHSLQNFGLSLSNWSYTWYNSHNILSFLVQSFMW